MCLTPCVNQPSIHNIIGFEVGYIYEIDSTHKVAEREQIDCKLLIEIITAVFYNPHDVCLTYGSLCRRLVQFGNLVGFERVIIRFHTLFLNGYIINSPQGTESTAYRVF